MTGLSREELLYAAPPFAFWAPEQINEIKKVFTEMQFGIKREHEFLFIRKNGERFPVLFSPSFMRNEQGDIEYFLVTFKDISERKQAENKLQQSEEKYKSLVENVNIGIFQASSEGKFIHANSTVLRMAGYGSWEQFKNLPTKALYADQADRDRFLSEMKEKGFVSNLEVRSLKKDGSVYWIAMSAVPMKDNDGKIISFLGTVLDITERIKAQQALVESEQRFRLLTDASFEAIAIHEKGIIMDVNQNMVKMFGYQLSELIGMSVKDLSAPETRGVIVNNVLSGYEESYEATALRKDGTTFFAELMGTQIPYNGRMARVTAIRDVTLRKKQQKN
jgi:PAS domain S-box-containing protein